MAPLLTAADTAVAVEDIGGTATTAEPQQTAPSARAQDLPEAWQNNDFWEVEKPRAPLLPTRTRAWLRTTDNVRRQLDVVLPCVAAGTDNVDERAKLAQSVRLATRLAFHARSHTAVRSSIATLSAVWAAALFGAVLAVVACLRWQLAWPEVFLLLAGQAVFTGLAYALEKLVFVEVMHRGLGSSRWTHIARLYARTVIYLTVGIGAMVAVLTLADRHHHLTWLEHLGLVAPLGCLAVVVGLWAAVAVAALGELVRAPEDPYPELVTSLLEADYLLRTFQAKATILKEPVLRQSQRLDVAIALERPARPLATDSGPCAPVGGAFTANVTGDLRAAGAKISAWLRQRETEVLAPNPDTGAAVLAKLDQGFKDACNADWGAVSMTPAADSGQPQSTWVARWAPRILITAFLLAGAFVIPAVLGKTLSPGAGTTLTVTLILSALTALAAPSTAVSTVASDISGLVKTSS